MTSCMRGGEARAVAVWQVKMESVTLVVSLEVVEAAHTGVS